MALQLGTDERNKIFQKSHDCTIENVGETLMDVNEVEELLNTMPGSGSKGLYTSSKSISNSSSSAQVASVPLKVVEPAEIDALFNKGELEELMQDQDIDEKSLLGRLKDDAKVDKSAALEETLFDNVTNVDQFTSLSQNFYLKKWVVVVEEFLDSSFAEAKLRKVIPSCKGWIKISGHLADGPIAPKSSANDHSQSNEMKSNWIARICSNNCIQDCDGQLYTLIGGMDLVATCLSDSKYDTGIFENGFGPNDFEWKENVLKILGFDLSLVISGPGSLLSKEVLNRDLFIEFQRLVTANQDTILPHALQEDAVMEAERNTQDISNQSTLIDSTEHNNASLLNTAASLDSQAALTKPKIAVSKGPKTVQSKMSKKTAPKKALEKSPVKKTASKRRVLRSSSDDLDQGQDNSAEKDESIIISTIPRKKAKTNSGNPSTSSRLKRSSPAASSENDSLAQAPRSSRKNVPYTTPKGKKSKSVQEDDDDFDPLVNVSRSGRLSKPPIEWWKV